MSFDDILEFIIYLCVGFLVTMVLLVHMYPYMEKTIKELDFYKEFTTLVNEEIEP